MTIAADSLMMVRADMVDRLERLHAALPRLTHGEIASSVDEVRSIARSYGLMPVAALASAFETSLSSHCSTLMIRQSIEAMRDMLGCESLPSDAAKLWLAALGARFPA